MSYAVGIDFGASNIKIVCVSPEGELLDRRTLETPKVESSDPGEAIRAAIARWRDERGRDADWIGLAAPGLAAADARSISWMQGRLEVVQGLDWTKRLDSTVAVRVLNDAQAALLGEIWKGSAAGRRDVVLLTLGTGVGGAVVCDGRLLRGRIGRAGHFGHLCLDADGEPDIVLTPGSLEDAIGDHTISKRSEGKFSSTRALVEAHLEGDAEATAVWLRSVHRLACAIVTIVNSVDPEAIVLGGGIGRAGPALLEPLSGYLDKMEWRPQGHRVLLLEAALGEMAGAYGAAYYALTFSEGD